MPIERRVDDLIAAGCGPLGPDVGPVALQHGRRKDFDYMTAGYGRVTFTPDFPKIAFAKGRKRGRKNEGN